MSHMDLNFTRCNGKLSAVKINTFHISHITILPDSSFILPQEKTAKNSLFEHVIKVHRTKRSHRVGYVPKYFSLLTYLYFEVGEIEFHYHNH